jgi:hypothetical protein
VFWNAVADNSIAVVGGKPPQQGSVDAAIVQIAVYDAVNAICGYPFTPYAVKPDVQVPALLEAAVAAAAHNVLAACTRLREPTSISSMPPISMASRGITKESSTESP